MQTSNLQVRVSDSVKHAAQIKAAEMRVTLGQLVEMALISMIGKKEPAK